MPDETLQMWVDKASEINAALADTTDELHTVEAKLDLTHRMVRAQRLMMIGLLGVLMLTLALALWNRATFNAVKSCTTVNGACHIQAGKDTARVIKKLNDEGQRQHDELLQEIRTGVDRTTTTTTTSYRTRESHSSTAPAVNTTSAPDTTSAPNSTTSTTFQQRATTTQPRPTTTTTRCIIRPVCI